MKRITLPALCGLILFFSGCSKKKDPEPPDLRNEYVGTWMGKISIFNTSIMGSYDNTVVISKLPGSKDKITAVDPSGNSTSFTATLGVNRVITVDSFRFTETIDGVITTVTSNYAVGPITDGKSLTLNGVLYSSKGTSYDGSWYGYWIKQ